MPDQLVIEVTSEEDTARVGGALAEALPAGSVVALCGTLGAGKTRLVQAVAGAYGIDAHHVVSPTFVLIQEHQGRRPIYHIDAYRIRDGEEFLDLGPDEYYEGEGVVLIEWADRVADCLPREYLRVEIEVTGPESRRFEITPHGSRYEPVVTQLAAAWIATRPN